ncbi:MAG: MGMT family protein [Thermodesulfobacteriota bacterium]|nr:MGMT family protein [Thermodesulfobacteriota bacterium]
MKTAEKIKAFFKGTAIKPPWEWMDMAGLAPLQQLVLRATVDIPYGSVRSYKQIAEAISQPRAYRFVGSSLAKNPFPILIPCHRVIRSDSSLGQFGGGTDPKKELIEMEKKFVTKKYIKERLL